MNDKMKEVAIGIASKMTKEGYCPEHGNERWIEAISTALLQVREEALREAERVARERVEVYMSEYCKCPQIIADSIAKLR